MIFMDYMHGRRQIVGEDKIATHTITPFAPPGGLSGSVYRRHRDGGGGHEPVQAPQS